MKRRIIKEVVIGNYRWTTYDNGSVSVVPTGKVNDEKPKKYEIDMKLFINYMPPNWNEYIKKERGNKFAANKLKQQEKEIIRYSTIGKQYKGNYPIEMVFKPHFKDHRQDLDNFRIKGVLDGLVACKVLKNDNLNHIQRIVLEPIFDNTEGVEIEIREVKK